MKDTLVAIAALLLLAAPASAIPGPDGADGTPNYFKLEIKVANEPLYTAPTVAATDVATFQESTGWDFGDRAPYRCAWLEFYEGGGGAFYQGAPLAFEVSYNAVSDYTGHLEISDRYGPELAGYGPGQISAYCWGDNTAQGHPFYADGSDHFPHGTSLVFYKDLDADGRIDAAAPDELARIPYDTNLCGNLYWTPGDEAGEAWLWWDEDGATDKFEHGDGLCGGGPIEPIAVVRAIPRNVAPGIAYCVTDSIDGDLCEGLSPAVTTSTLYP